MCHNRLSTYLQIIQLGALTNLSFYKWGSASPLIIKSIDKGSLKRRGGLKEAKNVNGGSAGYKFLHIYFMGSYLTQIVPEGNSILHITGMDDGLFATRTMTLRLYE